MSDLQVATRSACGPPLRLRGLSLSLSGGARGAGLIEDGKAGSQADVGA